MITKCFNPACQTPFDYRVGRLVRFSSKRTKEGNSENHPPIQHCWLCGTCSEHFTFEFKAGMQVEIKLHPQVLPKKNVHIFPLHQSEGTDNFMPSTVMVS
jgi:hypothetical protein